MNELSVYTIMKFEIDQMEFDNGVNRKLLVLQLIRLQLVLQLITLTLPVRLL